MGRSRAAALTNHFDVGPGHINSCHAFQLESRLLTKLDRGLDIAEVSSGSLHVDIVPRATPDGDVFLIPPRPCRTAERHVTRNQANLAPPGASGLRRLHETITPLLADRIPPDQVPQVLLRRTLGTASLGNCSTNRAHSPDQARGDLGILPLRARTETPNNRDPQGRPISSGIVVSPPPTTTTTTPLISYKIKPKID
jgi:hypothetical protein